jgi:plastocyanin
VGVAATVLLFPAAAEARTSLVFMGVPTKKIQKQLAAIATKSDPRAFMDINDFFPHGLTIHVGDKVSFIAAGFHSLDLPRKGKRPLPLISPNGTLVAGQTDEAHQPFWFNGKLPNVVFTPALLKSSFGKTFTYRGTRRILSGAPLSGRAKPLTVKFARAGTYRYFCNIHAGMTGVVRVVRRGRRIPARQGDAKRLLKAEVKRDLRQARKLVARTSVPARTLDVGASSGRSHVEYYGMLPGSLTVKRGTTLTFRMGPKVTDVHTAAFGTDDPGAQPPGAGYLTTLAKTFEGAGPFDPRAVWPSDPPGVTAALSPTTHGNGFWNSGVMDTVKGGPLPPSGKLTFNTPGTYRYYCLIHTNMVGTITVAP